MICDVCGEEFNHEPVKPAYVKEWKRIDGITCSMDCSRLFLEGKTKTIKRCAVCGKLFDVVLEKETGKILSGAYFGKLESIKGSPEYWECLKCVKK